MKPEPFSKNADKKCSHLERHAREQFDEIPKKDRVSWSTMIDGYLRADQLKETLFMCEPK